MATPKSIPPRGVLNYKEGSGNFGLFRYHPCPELEPFVEHFWIVRWNLCGEEPYKQDVLSHPSVQLVFEQSNTQFWGVVTGKFTRKIEGSGQVLGIKFRPASFYPFYQKPVSGFTDDTIPFSEVFDEHVEAVEATILSDTINEKMVNRAESFLLKHLPAKDPSSDKLNEIIRQIMDDKSIVKVDEVIKKIDLSKRTLQRLFRKYVGVSPKWVIQRYRLHEAAEKMADDEERNWTQLALELGYFDQSHFIRDFKSIIGQTPGEYLDSLET